MSALERVEVRPIVGSLTAEGEAAARAWLQRRSTAGEEVHVGEVFGRRGCEFGVVSCAPLRSGILGEETAICVSSTPVPKLERLQFCHLDMAPGEDTGGDLLYEESIRPYLLRLRQQRVGDNGHFLSVFSLNQVVSAVEREFAVRALDPDEFYGALDDNTTVFTGYVETPALARIHVLPYDDTLPGAYSYNLFRDFLKPFFQEHPFASYGAGDHFVYRGVRFRVMATDPSDAVARVVSRTMVYCEGDPLRPSVFDLLTPEMQAQLQHLPSGLQMLLLNTMANEEAVQSRLHELEATLTRGQGLASPDIDSCGREVVWKSADRRGETQQQCMVCLSEFAEGESLRQLECEHLFHKECIDEWLRRSAVCPICKGPVRVGATVDVSASASLLRRARVAICGGGGMGTVVGFDRGSQRFRVAMDGGQQEQLLASEDVVQLLRGVRLLGLQTAQLNGATGNIVGMQADRGRYLVQLSSQRTLGIRPENCILPDGVVARVVGLQGSGPGARWNSYYGIIREFDAGRFRHVVAMPPRGQLLSVRPQNLRV